jgi:hypothetical protein
MIVTAWNMGTHSRNGSGYGFKVKNVDRDLYFQKEWSSIVLVIEEETQPIEIALDSDKFWSENNYEIIDPAIGKWLRKNGLAPWPRGNPPTFGIEPLQDNRFKIIKLAKNKNSH